MTNHSAPNRLYSIERLEEMLVDKAAVVNDYPDYWGLMQQLVDTMRENISLKSQIDFLDEKLSEFMRENERLKHELWTHEEYRRQKYGITEGKLTFEEGKAFFFMGKIDEPNKEPDNG